MSFGATIVVVVAMVALIALRLNRVRDSGSWRLFGAEMLALALFAGFLHLTIGFPSPPDIVAKSGAASNAILVVLVAGYFWRLWTHFRVEKGE